jgi:hypothetical protein
VWVASPDPVAAMNPLDHPLLIFVISFLALAFAAWLGAFTRRRRQRSADVREYGIVESATLTLLALIVGFTFSMAIDRYGQRKQCEAIEANTIGTEYLRLSLLPAGETAKLQALMQKYLDQRIAFYKIQDPQQLQQIDAATARLQADMWATVSTAAVPPNPVVALAVSGMNDAIDAQGYTQASWWNRIPAEAWGLMILIALFSNFLLGYTSRAFEHEAAALLVMPLILSISFFLIADIDSPRWGLIHVKAQNLESLAASLHAAAVKP